MMKKDENVFLFLFYKCIFAQMSHFYIKTNNKYLLYILINYLQNNFPKENATF